MPKFKQLVPMQPTAEEKDLRKVRLRKKTMLIVDDRSPEFEPKDSGEESKPPSPRARSRVQKALMVPFSDFKVELDVTTESNALWLQKVVEDEGQMLVDQLEQVQSRMKSEDAVTEDISEKVVAYNVQEQKNERTGKTIPVRVGDCVQVTGFHNKAPQFRILGRKNVVLSIGVEKTDDATLHKAVCTAKIRHLEARSRCQLVDYTSYTDVSAVPGHYVLFWEVRGCKLVEEAIMEPSLEPSIMKACCDTVEKCLDAMYLKGKGIWIGPLEIRVVRQGTFHALMEYITSLGGASLGQYKTPRVVKLAPHLQLLNSRVSHSFFASS
ncbi:hypothetical protein L7F22_001314 [Adiantum nelumboides]|nr:hypothetical protein [Adiantum nelumboides]